MDCCTISSASRGMAGEFTVKATNDMGTAECKAMLKVNSKLLDLIEENLKSLTQFLYSAKPSADDPSPKLKSLLTTMPPAAKKPRGAKPYQPAGESIE